MTLEPGDPHYKEPKTMPEADLGYYGIMQSKPLNTEPKTEEVWQLPVEDYIRILLREGRESSVIELLKLYEKNPHKQELCRKVWAEEKGMKR